MDPANQLDNLRERIGESDAISAADREVLEAFDDRLSLLAERYSDHRHLKLLRHCTIIAERCGGLAAALEDREAAEAIVRWIHDSYDNPETNQDYRVALKVLGRRVTDAGEDGTAPPPSLGWISSTAGSDYDPTPDPAQMLDWETDVQAMLDAAANQRDAAAIAMQFDAGLRGSEFKALTVGDVSDHDYGLQVTVDGKQGRRSVTLILSVSYVTDWLGAHPRGDDPDAPLWCKLTSGEPMSDQSISNMFKRPAERAGVPKPVTLTAFRKSSASYLASRGLSQPHLEDHHGWVRGSDAAARYVSIFAEDADRELARVMGADVDEPDREPHGPIECPRCGERTPREKELCVFCGQALDAGAAQQAETLDSFVLEKIAESEGEEADTWLELHQRTRNDPELRAEAIERMTGLLDEH